MTLTAPGCGMGPHLVMEAKDRIEALEGVEAADVEMVWDPLGTRTWSARRAE